jgi:hypothetical protein
MPGCKRDDRLARCQARFHLGQIRRGRQDQRVNEPMSHTPRTEPRREVKPAPHREVTRRASSACAPSRPVAQERPPPPPSPHERHPRRFYAKATLDSNRPTPQVSNIAQSILSELDRARGTAVTLRLDIHAETADGFPEDIESVVRDNAASLRITDLGLRESSVLPARF